MTDPDGLLQLRRWAIAMAGHGPVRLARHGRALPPLILVTDEARMADPVAAARRLPRGSAVLLRHYGAPHRAALAADLAALCRNRGLLLLIGADSGLAEGVGADGLHLPERHLRRPPPWPRWGRLLTAAAHSPSSLQRAAEIGADAALLSPVFPTASHPDGPALGARRFTEWVGRANLPVYALGAVTAATAPRLVHSGAVGLAAVRGFSA